MTDQNLTSNFPTGNGQRIRLKGLNSKRKRLADGSFRTYYWAWKGGPALRGEPGSAQFHASYNEAVAPKIDKAPRPALRAGRSGAKPLIGVYLLMLNGEITYVGSSQNMPRSVAEHRSNGRPFDDAFYIATAAREREALERVLIAAVNPPQNRIGRSA
jgi:hypothetical protein